MWSRLNHPEINVHSDSRLPTPTTPLLFEAGKNFPVQISSSPVQASQVPDTNKSSEAPSVPVQRSPLANVPTVEKPKK